MMVVVLMAVGMEVLQLVQVLPNKHAYYCKYNTYTNNNASDFSFL